MKTTINHNDKKSNYFLNPQFEPFPFPHFRCQLTSGADGGGLDGGHDLELRGDGGDLGEHVLQVPLHPPVRAVGRHFLCQLHHSLRLLGQLPRGVDEFLLGLDLRSLSPKTHHLTPLHKWQCRSETHRVYFPMDFIIRAISRATEMRALSFSSQRNASRVSWCAAYCGEISDSTTSPIHTLN